MAHTPGPWGWTYDGSSDYSIGPAEDPQVERIVHVWASNRNQAATERAVADCNLITAAPDLLAAAKIGLKALTNLYEDYICLYPDEQAELDLVTAAIAKAEGR